MKKEKRKKNKKKAKIAMQADKSPTPALHALIRLQEHPVFRMDEKRRPFAMISDQDDQKEKIRAGDEPLTIREIKPK